MEVEIIKFQKKSFSPDTKIYARKRENKGWDGNCIETKCVNERKEERKQAKQSWKEVSVY